MTSAKVVEMSVTTTNNTPPRDYVIPSGSNNLLYHFGSSYLLFTQVV